MNMLINYASTPCEAEGLAARMISAGVPKRIVEKELKRAAEFQKYFREDRLRREAEWEAQRALDKI